MRAYAHKRHDRGHGREVFVDVHAHPKTTRCYGAESLIYEVEVRELRPGEESIYWGWHNYKDGQYHYVYQARTLVEICFAYGSEAEEGRGRGKVVRLAIEWTGNMWEEK